MEMAVNRAVIHWEAVQAVLAATAAHAHGLGVQVQIAVCDSSGLRAGFLRMPGASLHSADVAEAKAYTAASFGFATSQWATALKEHPADVQAFIRSVPRLVTIAGGVPIIVAGRLLGAIGVSGARAEQDEACALAGLAALAGRTAEAARPARGAARKQTARRPSR